MDFTEQLSYLWTTGQHVYGFGCKSVFHGQNWLEAVVFNWRISGNIHRPLIVVAFFCKFMTRIINAQQKGKCNIIIVPLSQKRLNRSSQKDTSSRRQILNKLLIECKKHWQKWFCNEMQRKSTHTCDVISFNKN